jgi:hypothetical protein
VTPTLSVEAVHESVKLLIVIAEAARPVGTEGGIVSGWAVTTDAPHPNQRRTAAKSRERIKKLVGKSRAGLKGDLAEEATNPLRDAESENLVQRDDYIN